MPDGELLSAATTEAATGGSTAAGAARLDTARARPRTVSPGELAWIAVVPCAVVTVIAIVVLGPVLGRALFSPGADQLWPPNWWGTQGRAEPVKQGRYAIAAVAPVLLVAAIRAGAGRSLTMRPRTIGAIVTATHATVLALVVVALLSQDVVEAGVGQAPPLVDLGAVVAAAVLVAVAALVLRRTTLTARIAALARETTTRRRVCLAIAAAFVATWLLEVLMTDRLAGDVAGLNLPFTMNDAMAVLNGRTPLVDYHVIYAKLLPYPTALVLSTFGTTIFVYTATMAVLTGLALLAVYAVFRLVTRSSLFALALLVPFVATSDLEGTPIAAGVVSPMTLPAMWPMRFGGVYLVAWLTARHVGSQRPRRAWVLFFVAWLAAVNSLEFGLGALGASVVAVLCARPPRSSGDALRLAAHVAAGALGAAALVCLVTLARAGALPDPSLLLEWPRIFGTLGWFSLPLPTAGLHLAIYATFVASIGLAVVRRSQPDDDVVLTSMLAWSGVFGLLAGSYFVGRPDIFRLTGILAPWSFALALLLVACVRTSAARGWRRPTLPHLLVFWAFALSLCALSRLSPPQEEIARLTRPLPDPVYQASAERFVSRRTAPGEKVALLVPMSFRIAHDLGLRNIAPYGFVTAVVTRSQLRTVVDAVRREHVRAIFTPAPGSFVLQEGDTAPAQLQALASIGFEPIAEEAGILELRNDATAAR